MKKFDYSGRPVQLWVRAPNTAVTMYDAIFSNRTMKLRLLIVNLLVYDRSALVKRTNIISAVGINS